MCPSGPLRECPASTVSLRGLSWGWAKWQGTGGPLTALGGWGGVLKAFSGVGGMEGTKESSQFIPQSLCEARASPWGRAG